MSLLLMVIIYLIDLIFWLWVIRWGGAEWLEGTFVSGFLIDTLAPRWSAEVIKFFGYVTIIASTILFILGIFFPELRYLL